jgi:hypothetical protein
VWNSWIFEGGMLESAKLIAPNVWNSGKPSCTLSISWTEKLYQRWWTKSTYLITGIDVTKGMSGGTEGMSGGNEGFTGRTGAEAAVSG